MQFPADESRELRSHTNSRDQTRLLQVQTYMEAVARLRLLQFTGDIFCLFLLHGDKKQQRRARLQNEDGLYIL